MAERRMAERMLKLPKFMAVGLDVGLLDLTLLKGGPGLLSMSPDSSRRRATAADERERRRLGRKGRPVRDHNKIPVMLRSAGFIRPVNAFIGRLSDICRHRALITR